MHKNRIFISIASYLDSMLLPTIKDAIYKAEHPELLRIGVVDQNYIDQRNSIHSIPGCEGIRYLHVHPEDTFGPSWARHLACSLYDEEEYFLQIDSHTAFETNWDSQLRTQYISLLEISSKPIITTYPYGFTLIDGEVQYDKQPPNTLLAIRSSGFRSDNSIFLKLCSHQVPSEHAIRGYHLAGGFIFSKSQFIEEVPYDPYLYFWSDEQSISLRAFTNGWDIFHTTYTPLYHLYKIPEKIIEPQHWGGDAEIKRLLSSTYLHNRAESRFKKILSDTDSFGIYGLGHERTLDEFIEFSGIDYKNKVINEINKEKYNITLSKEAENIP